VSAGYSGQGCGGRYYLVFTLKNALQSSKLMDKFYKHSKRDVGGGIDARGSP